MYDFCFSFPYAALLFVGGLIGFLVKGSTASLASASAASAVISACGYYSLNRYHKGQLCKPATLISLGVAAYLTMMMYQRYQRTKAIMPAGLVAVISAAMTCFYMWSLVAGPVPKSAAAKLH